MMKPFLVALMLSPTIAIATPFQGFFVTAQLGMNAMSGDHSHKTTQGQGKSKFEPFKSISPSYGVGGGYITLNPKKILYGGEIYYKSYSGKPKTTMKIDAVTIGDVAINRKRVFGGSIIGGIATSPKVVMYGKVSYELDNHELEYSKMQDQTPTTEKYKIKSKVLTPYAGILFRVSEHFNIAGEFGVALYPKKEPRQNTGTPIKTFAIEPQEYRLNIGIMYVF